MVPEIEPGKLVHLRLPLPDLRQLAATMTTRPSPEVANAIIRSARQRARRLGNWKVDPYRLGAALRRAGHQEVTDAQVAWVLLIWLRLHP